MAIPVDDEKKDGAAQENPKLFFDGLNQLPQVVRFVMSGCIGNGIFIFVYNQAYRVLQHFGASASVVFAIVQFFCIILNHALNMGLIFGWPTNHYVQSLMSNMPVGLTSLAMGTFLAGYLEKNDFDGSVNNVLASIGVDTSRSLEEETEEEKGGFYTSIAVMLATGIFNFVVLNIINSKPRSGTDSKKEL